MVVNCGVAVARARARANLFFETVSRTNSDVCRVLIRGEACGPDSADDKTRIAPSSSKTFRFVFGSFSSPYGNDIQEGERIAKCDEATLVALRVVGFS